MSTGDGTEETGGTADADPSEEGPGTFGVLVRLAVALFAVALGLFWIVRLAFVGSTLRGGLLFELLAPLVLLYFGIDYLRTQRRVLSRDGEG